MPDSDIECGLWDVALVAALRPCQCHQALPTNRGIATATRSRPSELLAASIPGPDDKSSQAPRFCHGQSVRCILQSVQGPGPALLRRRYPSRAPWTARRTSRQRRGSVPTLPRPPPGQATLAVRRRNCRQGWQAGVAGRQKAAAPAGSRGGVAGRRFLFVISHTLGAEPHLSRTSVL